MNSRSNDLALLVLRLFVGGLMLLHGIHKISQGFDAGLAQIELMLTEQGLPEALAIGVYVGEILAPVLLILGVLVRPAALIVGFTMLMSIWLAYGSDLFATSDHGGSVIEVNLLYFAGSLALALAGGGRIAIRRGSSGVETED